MVLWIKLFIRDILEEKMVPHADNNMPLLWTFQKESDLKRKFKLVRQWFETNQIEASSISLFLSN